MSTDRGDVPPTRDPIPAVLRAGSALGWRLLVVVAALYVVGVILCCHRRRQSCFIAVHQGVMGVYLGCSFAPNHKGMPIITEGRLDHLHKQVLTSRNVTGGRWVDALLGGLDHQIEHHLYPHMPRPNLRRAQPVVENVCTRNGIPYNKPTLRHSNAQVLRHLHDAGSPLRQPAQ